ncbi:hypothetical protein BASA81_011154 [Batrachochytrium salamandrivorans]|nr:hypothetical protein BASA81_011154 [Batrachochytrium salamandrivorans]
MANKKRKLAPGPGKKQKPGADHDSEISFSSDEEAERKQLVLEDHADKETATEKRTRMANDLMSKLAFLKKKTQDGEEEGEEDFARALRKQVLQQDGRLVRKLATNLSIRFKTEPVEHSFHRSSHSQSVTSVALSQDESKCFSAGKDGSLVGWDLETNTSFWKASAGKTALSLALSSDGQFLATAGDGNKIKIWDVREASAAQRPVKVLSGHKDLVSGLVFRHNSHTLLSSSADRCVQLWNVDEGSFIEQLFGHSAKITSVDCLSRERCITASEDLSVRLWKIPEESHLVLQGRHTAPIDCVKMLNESVFASGSQEGSLALWGASSKRPTSIVPDAHGPGNWLSAITAIRGSDVIATGSNDGLIRVWAVNMDRLKINPDPIAALPCTGHINALAFGVSGTILVAGGGQEPRMGRWRVNKEAKNGVHVFRLPASSAAMAGDHESDEE